MHISKSLAEKLLSLINGEELSYSAFKGVQQKLIGNFISDHVLEYRIIGSQLKKIYCPDSDKLIAYLSNKFGVNVSLEEYISFLSNEDTTRADAVLAASDSKIKGATVLQGFFVNVSQPVQAKFQSTGISFEITYSSSSLLFVHNTLDFIIPEHITVVVVEGYENFKKIAEHGNLFQDSSYLFVWRYQNMNCVIDWLKSIPNDYLHFGDFDPKGIHIYLSEFKAKLPDKNCSFFIPDNVEVLIQKYGRRELYENQIERLRNADFSKHPEIALLFEIIQKLKKGLEQEILLNAEISF